MDVNAWRLAQFTLDITSFISEDISLTNSEKRGLACRLGGIDFVSCDKEGTSDHEKFCLLIRKGGSFKYRDVNPILFRPRIIDPGAVKVDEVSADDNEDSVVKNANKRAQKRDKLTEVFGSSKNIRRLSDSRQLNLSAGSREFTKAAEEAEKSLKQTRSEDTIRDLLPPYDLTATSPAGAYDLSAVVQPRLLELLSDEAGKLAEATAVEISAWREGDVYPRSVLKRLSALPIEAEHRRDAAARLALLHCFVSLFRLTYREVSRKVPLPMLSSPLAHILLESYTELTSAGSSTSSQHRCMPARLKDKVLYHALLLCLSLDSWTTDFTDLLVDFKIPANRLLKYFLALGCTVKKVSLNGELTQMATLKVPLTFPVVTFSTRKKKA